MVRIARYLGISRSLDSSVEEPKRYELPAGEMSVRWWARLGVGRREADERSGAGGARVREPVILRGVRILF